jgi:uncharacterized protein
MRRLALFARPVEAGSVKTRLSPALPAPLAAALYQGMLADALASGAAAHADERIVYWASAPGTALTPTGWRERAQRGADLGERLSAAFDALLEGGAHGIAYGADCPWLDGARLDALFDALTRADVALIPARDGGYAAIGLAHREPALFAGIAWSTAAVCEQTRDAARRAGLEVASLDPLEDVDTAGDVARLVAALPFAAEDVAPNTARALAAIGLAPSRGRSATSSRPAAAAP